MASDSRLLLSKPGLPSVAGAATRHAAAAVAGSVGYLCPCGDASAPTPSAAHLHCGCMVIHKCWKYRWPGLWQGNMASSCAAAENRTESWATSQNFDRALLKGHTPKTHVICGWMMLNDVECSSPRGTSLVEQFRATKSSFLGLNLAICWILLGQNHLWTSDWWLQIESLRTSDLSSLGRFIYIHSDLSGIFVHVEMHLLLLHPRHICIAAAWSSTNVGSTGDMTQPHIFKQPAGYNMAKTTLDHNFSVTKGQLPLLISCQNWKMQE